MAKQAGKLAGRTADLLWPYPCEVANSIGILRELSWLTRGMAKVEFDCKAAGLRSARLPRLCTATGSTATLSKFHCANYVRRGCSALARIGDRLEVLIGAATLYEFAQTKG